MKNIKPKFFICCILMTISDCFAQRSSIGLGAGGGGFSPIYVTPEQQRQNAYDAKIAYCKGYFYRTIDGKVSDIRGEKWGLIDGKVDSIENKVLILNSGYHTYIAITNFVGSPLDGELFRTLALWKGSYDMGGRQVAFYDCGKLYIPPPPTAAQIQAAKEASAKLKAQNDSKAAQAQIKVVEWLKNNVTNGAASDQRALAEHYLKGEGCETNPALAMFWLQKASDQGDIDASNKLISLQK